MDETLNYRVRGEKDEQADLVKRKRRKMIDDEE